MRILHYNGTISSLLTLRMSKTSLSRTSFCSHEFVIETLKREDDFRVKET